MSPFSRFMRVVIGISAQGEPEASSVFRVNGSIVKSKKFFVLEESVQAVPKRRSALSNTSALAQFLSAELFFSAQFSN